MHTWRSPAPISRQSPHTSAIFHCRLFCCACCSYAVTTLWACKAHTSNGQQPAITPCVCACAPAPLHQVWRAPPASPPHLAGRDAAVGWRPLLRASSRAVTRKGWEAIGLRHCPAARLRWGGPACTALEEALPAGAWRCLALPGRWKWPILSWSAVDATIWTVSALVHVPVCRRAIWVSARRVACRRCGAVDEACR